MACRQHFGSLTLTLSFWLLTAKYVWDHLFKKCTSLAWCKATPPPLCRTAGWCLLQFRNCSLASSRQFKSRQSLHTEQPFSAHWYRTRIELVSFFSPHGSIRTFHPKVHVEERQDGSFPERNDNLAVCLCIWASASLSHPAKMNHVCGNGA